MKLSKNDTLRSLSRYSSVATAGLAAASSAHAAISYSGPQNISITSVNTQTDALQIDLFGGGSEFTTGHPTIGELEFYYYSMGSNFWVAQPREGTFNPGNTVGVSNSRFVESFAGGETLPLDFTAFGPQQNLDLQQNFQGTTGFLGFRTATSQSEYEAANYNYGWVQLAYAGDGNSLTVIDWAVETNVNESIEVGAVPEPSTAVLLLAAGAAGMGAYRRRRVA